MTERELVLSIVRQKHAQPVALDRARTALLVIDVQRYFAQPAYPFSRVLESLAPGVTTGYFELCGHAYSPTCNVCSTPSELPVHQSSTPPPARPWAMDVTCPAGCKRSISSVSCVWAVAPGRTGV